MAAQSLNRPLSLRENAFDWKLQSDSRVNSMRWDVQFSTPCHDAHSLAVEFKEYVISSIVSLCKIVSPIAIVRTIRSIIVSAFQRIFPRWPLPHVTQKGSEIVLPVVANSDASRAIVFISMVRRPETSRLHRTPYFIFWRVSQSVCFKWIVSLKAAAGLRSTVDQISRLDEFFKSAITATDIGKSVIRRSFLFVTNYSPTCKSISFSHVITGLYPDGVK